MRSRSALLIPALAASSLVVAALMTSAGDARACMHPRVGAPAVGQVSQEAIILHHEGVQDLILRVDYKLAGAESLAIVEVGDGDVAGPCDKETVRRVVEKRHAPLRYCYVKALKRHPEVLEIEIERPIIIAGLPRSGTTHLLNLIAADERLRSLPYWESLEPIPDPNETPGVGRHRGETMLGARAGWTWRRTRRCSCWSGEPGERTACR